MFNISWSDAKQHASSAAYVTGNGVVWPSIRVDVGSPASVFMRAYPAGDLTPTYRRENLVDTCVPIIYQAGPLMNRRPRRCRAGAAATTAARHLLISRRWWPVTTAGQECSGQWMRWQDRTAGRRTRHGSPDRVLNFIKYDISRDASRSRRTRRFITVVTSVCLFHVRVVKCETN